ncbi:colorectal neoplasia differentially expressed peptide [Ailuropoda melanoleuca]|uniref:colorectal neoplasia differentially expressed peptide n=1 Tax=Ailuropoda melanoleuca TaxID=9646 RepID=UPI0014945CB6|nr:colorectal neoplasia differentially expressed peptide [Ailuropoda melanoleuca]
MATHGHEARRAAAANEPGGALRGRAGGHLASGCPRLPLLGPRLPDSGPRRLLAGFPRASGCDCRALSSARLALPGWTLERRPQDDNHIPGAPISSNFPSLLSRGGVTVPTQGGPWWRVRSLRSTKSRRRGGGAGRGVGTLLSWRREACGRGGGHSRVQVAASRPRLRRGRETGTAGAGESADLASDGFSDSQGEVSSRAWCRSGGRGELPRPVPLAPASRGPCAPQRPPPAPPAAAAAAAAAAVAPRANGRQRPARAARRGLEPATRERPRPARSRGGGENLQVITKLLCWLSEGGDSEDREIQLLGFETSCGLFNLDAKDLEQSSAQEVYIVLDVPIYRQNCFSNSHPQLLCRRRSYSS